MVKKTAFILMMMSFTLLMGCRISRYSVHETTPVPTDDTIEVNTQTEPNTEIETKSTKNDSRNFLPYTGESSFQGMTILGDMIVLLGADFKVDCYIYDYDKKIFVRTTDYECAQLGNRIIYYKDKDRAYGLAQGQEDEFYISNKPTDTAFYIEDSNDIHSLNLTDGKLTARLSDLDICKDTYAHYDFSEDTSRAIITMTPASDPDTIQYRYWDTSTDETNELVLHMELFNKVNSISSCFSFFNDNTLGVLVTNDQDNSSSLLSYDFNTNVITKIKDFDIAFNDFTVAGNYCFMESEENQKFICIDRRSCEIIWEEKIDINRVYMTKEYDYVLIKFYTMDEVITVNFDTKSGAYEQVDNDYHNLSKIGLIVKTTPNGDGVSYQIVE